MITCVFSTYQDSYPILITILKKYFRVIVCIKSELKHQFSKFKQISDSLIEYNDYNAEQLINSYIYKGHYLVLKDNEKLKINNSQSYSVLFRIENKSELYVETNDNKYKGKFTEDFLTDIIINSIKSFQTTIAYKYDSVTYFMKGTNYNQRNIPLIMFQKDNKINIKESLVDNNKNMINVLPLTNWTSSSEFINHLNKFRPENSNINFTLNAPEYALVVNETNISTTPMKTLYFMMEPNGEKLYSSYLSKFNTTVSDANKLLYNGSHSNHLNLQEYWINKSHSELLSSIPSKTYDKVLSVCISDRYVDPGHKYRIDLIKKLDKMCSENQLCFDIHIYGKCKSLNFINYKGECPEKDKSKALWNYKYHFTAENHSIHNYITEKFNDSLVSECYLFYYGAPNATLHFGDCFTPLSGNIDEDIDLINKQINEDIYSSTKNKIREVKKNALIEQNVFNRVESIITIVKSAFITIKTPKNSFNLPNNENYFKYGWIALGGIVVENTSNFLYLKPILEIGITNQLHIFMNWSDREDSFDKTCRKITHNFNADLVTLDNIVNYSSIFTSDLFIPNKTIKILFQRLSQSNYNITLEELLKDLIII